MRELIITAFISIDGVMEGPGNGPYRNAGWTFKKANSSERRNVRSLGNQL